MRVLLTTDTIGGVWTFTKELAVGLLVRGHAVALVSLGRLPSSSQGSWAKAIGEEYGSRFRYEAFDSPLEWMHGNREAYSGAEGSLLAVVDSFKVDIVHASQFCFGALPVEIPKIVTAHSDVLSWAEACRPDGIEDSGWLRSYLSLVRAGMNGANTVVAPTRWMNATMRRLFQVKCESLVIPNGRSLAPSSEIPRRNLQAVTVGRLWDQGKGLAILHGVEVPMPILIVGEDRFQGERAATPGTTEYLGQLDENEVLQVFRASSLYIATSIYEPFGLAPLEAALCGCGVVARDIASFREIWGDAAEYFTDGKTMTELLARLCHSTAEREALRYRSMERALQLSADRMVDRYVTLYENSLSLVGGSGRVAAYAG